MLPATAPKVLTGYQLDGIQKPIHAVAQAVPLLGSQLQARSTDTLTEAAPRHLLEQLLDVGQDDLLPDTIQVQVRSHLRGVWVGVGGSRFGFWFLYIGWMAGWKDDEDSDSDSGSSLVAARMTECGTTQVGARITF